MHYYIAAIEKGKFAEHLAQSFWQAFGPLFKMVGIIAVVIFIVIPLLMWIKKVLR